MSLSICLKLNCQRGKLSGKNTQSSFYLKDYITKQKNNLPFQEDRDSQRGDSILEVMLQELEYILGPHFHQLH